FGVIDQREARLTAGLLMRRVELFGFCPGFEIGTRTPDGVRCVEHVIVTFRPFNEMENDKAGHLAESALPIEPDLLKIVLRALHHLQPVHCDEHRPTLLLATASRAVPLANVVSASQNGSLMSCFFSLQQCAPKDQKLARVVSRN